MSQEEEVVIPTQEEVAQYGGESVDPGGDTAAGPSDPSGGSVSVAPENEWKEIALRARAELSNYQKRAEKDRSEALRYAHASLVKALLPVLDNLERIVQTGSESAGSAQAVVDGAKLTLEAFLKVLRDFHVEPIVSEGQPFDPRIHEAMMERPSDHAERTVLQEVARGYRLHERVLRPAKVIVSKPSAE